MSADAYVIDTKVLIDYLGDQIPEDNHHIDEVFQDDFTVSVISKIEFLGWTGFLDDHDALETARDFIERAEVVAVDEEIAEIAIELRQREAVPLADSVIASTALRRNATLVTRNVGDFEALTSLDLYNPHDLQSIP